MTLHVVSSSSAMNAALAEIEREFGPIGHHKHFKGRIRRVLREPDHPAIAARYGSLASLVRLLSLPDAADIIHRCYRAERKAFQLAAALGGGSRLNMTVLEELRLILRWLRYTRRNAQFATFAAEIARRAA